MPSHSTSPTLTTLSGTVSFGLMLVASVAMLSAMTSSMVLVFLALQFVRNIHRYIYHNYCAVLVFNLCLANLFQAVSLVLSLDWYSSNVISAPSTTCAIQAGLFQFGDIASAIFVLKIALNTVYSMMKANKLHYPIFVISVVSAWTFALVLTISGPLRYGAAFYTAVEHQCWIAPQFAAARLWLHYSWVLLALGATLTIYAGLFIYLRRQLARAAAPAAPAVAQISRAACAMVLYALAAAACALPLAAGRMVALAGGRTATSYSIAALALAGAAGFVDGLLYGATRRVFAATDLDGAPLVAGVAAAATPPAGTGGEYPRDNPHVLWRPWGGAASTQPPVGGLGGAGVPLGGGEGDVELLVRGAGAEEEEGDDDEEEEEEEAEEGLAPPSPPTPPPQEQANEEVEEPNVEMAPSSLGGAAQPEHGEVLEAPATPGEAVAPPREEEAVEGAVPPRANGVRRVRWADQVGIPDGVEEPAVEFDGGDVDEDVGDPEPGDAAGDWDVAGDGGLPNGDGDNRFVRGVGDPEEEWAADGWEGVVWRQEPVENGERLAVGWEGWEADGGDEEEEEEDDDDDDDE